MACIHPINFISTVRQSIYNINALELFVKKTLLQRVKESGTTREIADLKLICDFDPDNFGCSGTKKRRSAQKYLGYIKKPF